MTRLPTSAHTSQPWRIHRIAPDFRVEDVWALPTPGGPDDFPMLVGLATHVDLERGSSAVVRALFAVRWKLGELLGWDDPDARAGVRVSSLRDRLPADLRNGAAGPGLGLRLGFTPLYLAENEWAAELANRTMHGVLHLGWVPDGHGGCRGQMAVLVKRNGLLGHAYMAAIAPFRHLIVYPRMLEEIGRRWQSAREIPQTGDREPRPGACPGAR